MAEIFSNTANLVWRENQPYSKQFEDIYFSSENGLAETDYVFLQGNQLATRWQQTDFTHFTIAETGFGTGLNFLCAADCWLKTAPKNAKLHFISVEKFPLSFKEIEKTCAMWSALAHLTPEFLTLYQQLISTDSMKENSGFLGDKNIQLTLLIDNISDCLEKINYKVDAWFLDGFAPAKNPDMWQENLFQSMANLAQANTTFATFTASGMVKRGLKAAGFTTIKKPGFGKKREMLTGFYSPQNIT